VGSGFLEPFINSIPNADPATSFSSCGGICYRHLPAIAIVCDLCSSRVCNCLLDHRYRLLFLPAAVCDSYLAANSLGSKQRDRKTAKLSRAGLLEVHKNRLQLPRSWVQPLHVGCCQPVWQFPLINLVSFRCAATNPSSAIYGLAQPLGQPVIRYKMLLLQTDFVEHFNSLQNAGHHSF